MKSLQLLFIGLLHTTSLAEYTEICSYKAETLKCVKSNEIIIVEEAQFGRMKKSKCLKDETNLGCHIDIIRNLRPRCSGRNSCNLDFVMFYTDNNIAQIEPDCLGDSKGFLSVKWRCQKVASANDCKTAILGDETSFIASNISFNTKCGQANSPWKITVPDGQRVKVEVEDYSHNSSQNCQVKYAFLQDAADTSHNQSLCSTRKSFISKSTSLLVTHEDSISNRKYYALKYSADGCRNPVPPRPGLTITRVGDDATVYCNETKSLKYRLICDDQKWRGFIGNCTVPSVRTEETKSDEVTILSISLPYGIWIALIIGISLVISAVILVIGLLILKRQRQKYQRELHQRALSVPASNASKNIPGNTYRPSLDYCTHPHHHHHHQQNQERNYNSLPPSSGYGSMPTTSDTLSIRHPPPCPHYDPPPAPGDPGMRQTTDPLPSPPSEDNMAHAYKSLVRFSRQGDHV